MTVRLPPRGSMAIERERICALNDAAPRRGAFVLYWMQQAQRAEFNPALEYAVARADALGLPVAVAFGLTDAYPEANLRHYAFLIEGLADVRDALQARGIAFALAIGDPAEVALRAARRAALIVCDRGYLRHQRAWRERVAREAGCEVVQVEGEAVVPVEAVSDHAEFAARTIRPKIHRLLDRFARVPAAAPAPARRAGGRRWTGMDLVEPEDALSRLKTDRTVPAVGAIFRGGPSEARRRFRAFLKDRFAGYAENRNQPQTDDVSGMAMYLHYGHVSPVWLAAEARSAAAPAPARDAFLEELCVRRELANNFTRFAERYDSFEAIPAWARRTLDAHRRDARRPAYSRDRLDAAATHDPYWNAAMREMKHTGYLHNYMRMYWGKKILEWSASPEEAFESALALNNRYLLDGRDPSSYAGVGWVFGLHDRPWTERPVFGMVRYMNAAGLERKCDIEAYVRKVESRQ